MTPYSTLPPPSKPINRIGKRMKRLNPWMKQEAAAVKARSGNRCELHLEAPCGAAHPHWHHIARREGIVGSVIASWRLFGVHLCDRHHREIHAQPGGWVEQWAVIDALTRMQDAFPEFLRPGDETWAPMDRMRAAERWFVSQGIDPQQWSAALVKAGR